MFFYIFILLPLLTSLPIYLNNRKIDEMSLIVSLIIGGVAGWLAGNIMKDFGHGMVKNIIIGSVGGVIGGFVLGLVGISLGSGIIGSMITATLGAVLLLWLIDFLKKKKK